MRDKTAAFKNAADALSQLGIPKKLPTLRRADVFVRRLILGGSHSVVTYPPLNTLKQLGPRDSIYPICYGKTTNLYVHIAFCETMCTFCHYTVRNYRGQQHSSNPRVEAVNRYLNALKAEIRDWAEELRMHGTSISSIYIGGGTPLVLEQTQLVDLLQTIKSEFQVLPGADICVEGSPLTITADGGIEKLRALKEMGMTRLSFGVQSFDDEVLKYSARGYKQGTAIRACEIASEVFENWNLDLIQSLYKGRPDEVWANIEVLRELRPPHLTWYHGRFAKRPQGDWFEDAEKRVNFEGEQATLMGRMLIWEELAAEGYQQVDGNRFVLGERFVDPFKKSRTSVSNNLLGLGASAYSHVDLRAYPRDFRTPDGVFFRNSTDIDDYVARVEKGASAIATALELDPEEYLAGSYVVGLRTGRVEPELLEFERPPAPELIAHYRELEDHFLELGLLERLPLGNEQVLKLSRLGTLFEDEVLSLFYSPWVKEVLA